ncbi:class I SAM-dependent methyltransferase [Streptomyces cellulosae]|uniref:Class I SAM-dependent methyltransferase n=1 Tax=Streptomyces cellulosae TaxID=1968 RepID=A0ABW6JLL1_STRCE
MTTSGADQVTHTARAHSFNAVAAQYADHRPTYPPALFDAIEDLTGRPLAGTRVADIGAGTGLATARLLERGAHVVAVEPGEDMAAEFRRRLPGTPVVRGDGNALPLAAGSADLITYAQSWHWTDPARSVPEALRVLRPGGSLALWWNTSALDVPWIAEASARAGEHFGRDFSRGKDDLDAPVADPSGRLGMSRHLVRWSRRIPVDAHLANIGSHSLFLVQDPGRTTAFLAEERRHVLEVFPDGIVEETYDVVLLLASKPPAA